MSYWFNYYVSSPIYLVRLDDYNIHTRSLFFFRATQRTARLASQRLQNSMREPLRAHGHVGQKQPEHKTPQSNNAAGLR